MKCVEQGLLKLDDDVTLTVLPEFKHIQVLEAMKDDGQDGETPVLRPSTGKITLRQVKRVCPHGRLSADARQEPLDSFFWRHLRVHAR